jgi:hypothetical protein
MQKQLDLDHARAILDRIREQLSWLAGYGEYSTLISKAKHDKTRIISFILAGAAKNKLHGIDIESIRRAANLIVGPSEFRRICTAMAHGESVDDWILNERQ